MLALAGLGYWAARPAAQLAPRRPPQMAAIVLASQRWASPAPAATSGPRDSIVRLALRQLGTPYVWAGTSPTTGFDCSGLITYVFSRFGVATPHATALLISAGRPVPRAQAQPGDIVVFTGTAEGSTMPGHAGIVISALGETPLRFVHASSARRESGVKVSQVENSGYERRFLQVRRVLDGAAGASPTLATIGQPVAPRPPARPAGAVAPLPAAAPTAAADLAVTLPDRLAPVPVRRRSRTGAKPAAAHPKVATATKRTVPASRSTAAKKATPANFLSKKAALKKPAPNAFPKKRVPRNPAPAGHKTTRPTAKPKPATHRATSKTR